MEVGWQAGRASVAERSPISPIAIHRPFFLAAKQTTLPVFNLKPILFLILTSSCLPLFFHLGQLAYYNFLNNMYRKIISVTSFFNVPAQLTTTFWLYYSPVPPDIKTYSNHIQLYSANCIRIKVRINNLFCTTVEFSVMDNVLESPYSLDASAKEPGKHSFSPWVCEWGLFCPVPYVERNFCFVFFSFLLVEACAGDVPSILDHFKILNFCDCFL